MSNSNEYMLIYMKDRHKKRMAEFKAHLGGKCVKCSSTDNLQFDHIDPTTKKYTIAQGWNRKDVYNELDKCQLLCEDCHIKKSRFDMTGSYEITHGFSRYDMGCRCDICKTEKAKWAKEYNKKNPRCRKKICTDDACAKKHYGYNKKIKPPC